MPEMAEIPPLAAVARKIYSKAKINEKLVILFTLFGSSPKRESPKM